MIQQFNRSTAGILIAGALVLAACGGERGGDRGGDGAGGEQLSGTVQIDGSSTVFPIAEAMAEEFSIENSGVRVPVGLSGTGGGFKKFCAGETDISNASRPIKESELETCRAAGIEPIEIPIAWDGLTVVRNPENDWATCMTVDELKRVWQPGSTVRRWNQVRSAWPNEEIILYGPDTDSGTFDYFTEAVVGEGGASRQDYTASADDNVLVVGVAGDRGGLGYFGFAYFEESQGQLAAVEVDNGAGCVGPTRETIEDGTYAPLSRPMFVYTREQALAKPPVVAFLRFWMENSAALVPDVGYVPLTAQKYEENLAMLGRSGGMRSGSAGTKDGTGDAASGS